MLKLFRKLEAMASKAITRIHNDGRFRLYPMTEPYAGARRIPDPDRSEIVDLCSYDYQSIEFGMELGVRKSYKEANDLRSVSVGREPYVSIERRVFPSLDAEPQKYDLIELLDFPSLPRFEVLDVQRDGMSRLVLRLVHKGTQA